MLAHVACMPAAPASEAAHTHRMVLEAHACCIAALACVRGSGRSWLAGSSLDCTAESAIRSCCDAWLLGVQ